MAVTIEDITYNVNAIDWATRDTGFIPEDGDIWYYYNNSSYPNTIIYLIGDGTNTIDNLTLYTPMNDQPQTIRGAKSFKNAVSIGDGISSTSTNFLTATGSAALSIITSSGDIVWVYGKSSSENFVISRYIAGIYQEATLEIDNSTGATMFGKALQMNNGFAAGSFFSLLSAGNPQWNLNNNSGVLREFFGGTVARTMNGTTGNGQFNFNLHVAGTLSKSAGTFDIPHVLPELENEIGLRHSFVESPIISNTYYGTVKLKKGKATVNIDKEFNMTEGTFLALNTDFKYFTKNENSYIRTKSELIANVLEIEAEDIACEDEIYWEVKGRRHDKFIMQSDITDKYGKLIIEYKMEQTLEEKEIEKAKNMQEFEAREKAKKEATSQ